MDAVERSDGSGGFTLLDGAALVIGAAVASVHMREVVTNTKYLRPLDWALIWLTFTGVALSAAGPFEYLARRYVRRPAGYPRIGDRLWVLLGSPWLLTALFRPATPAGATGARGLYDLYRFSLWLAIGASSLISLAVVWRTWVVAPPGHGLRDGPSPWTERVGLALAIAWPLQFGFGLVVAE
jgi:hypothetical protein